MSVFGVILVCIFPAFSRIWPEYVKIRMRITMTLNTDPFYVVLGEMTVCKWRCYSYSPSCRNTRESSEILRKLCLSTKCWWNCDILRSGTSGAFSVVFSYQKYVTDKWLRHFSIFLCPKFTSYTQIKKDSKVWTRWLTEFSTYTQI